MSVVPTFVQFIRACQQNKLTKARKMRKPPGTLSLKKIGLGNLWVEKVWTPNTCNTCNTLPENTLSENTLLKNTLSENTVSENTIFRKYTIRKYT